MTAAAPARVAMTCILSPPLPMNATNPFPATAAPGSAAVKDTVCYGRSRSAVVKPVASPTFPFSQTASSPWGSTRTFLALPVVLS